jgi:hypothetical protein
MTDLYLRYTPVALYELNRLADIEDLYAMARIHCAVVGDGLLGEDRESLLLDSPLIPADDGYEFYAQSGCKPCLSRYRVRLDSSCKSLTSVEHCPSGSERELTYSLIGFESKAVSLELNYPADAREYLADLTRARVPATRKAQAKLHGEVISQALPGETPGALRIERVARPVGPETYWNVEYVSTATGRTYYCGLSNDGVEVASLFTRTPEMHYAPVVWWDAKPGSYATPR